MNAQAKPKDWIDPVKEAEAVKALRESLKTMLGGEEPDEQLFADSIEGETSLFELIDQLLHRRAVNLALADGVDRLANDLDARRTRFLQRAEADKALIEQAMMIAELKKVERPGATLSLAARAPKLVVESEPDIPAQWWKQGEPTLDKKGLTDALKARASALEGLPEDPEARAAAIAALPPEIPGVCLSNAAPSLTVRVK